MKPIHILWLASLCLTACAREQNEHTSEVEPATEVTLTHPVHGHILQETIFSATTVYQNKTSLSAPVSSFITEVRVKPGTRVKAGQLLYRLESKEQRALGHDGKDIEIKAGQDGIILDVLAQTESYVSEGTTLCVLADAGSLVFEINVPYEQREQAQAGSHCTLELPDGTCLMATVQSPLATMHIVSQSERVVAVANAPFLPEGLNVKAVFTSRSTSREVMLLPKTAVQSDETLTAHWIMLLADDSTAVKIPVTIGCSTADSIEILSPILSSQDRIIRTGGYGLKDKARVTMNQ